MDGGYSCLVMRFDPNALKVPKSDAPILSGGKEHGRGRTIEEVGGRYGRN